MRAKVWVEHEVEVEISAGDAISALMDLDEPERLPMALSGLSACHGWMRRIPDSLIAEMNEKQRSIIVSALEDQAARYKTPNGPHEGPGSFSPGPLDAVVGPQAKGGNDGNLG